MGKHNVEICKRGEQDALAHLQQLGYKLMKCNWRAGRHGELDIIVEDADKAIVFFEVKTRCTYEGGDDRTDLGIWAVDGRKEHRIIRLALRYLDSQKLTLEDVVCRFDVLVVHYRVPKDETPWEAEFIHVKDAFHHCGWG